MTMSPLRLTAITLGALLAVTVAACGSSASPGHSSAGSCAAGSPSAYFAAARMVFIGILQPGPVVSTGQGSVLASPARVRVVRYLRGNGPAVVTVRTGVTRSGSGNVTSEDGIQPRAGQRWKIYTTSRLMPYQTSICEGSAPASSAS